MTKPEPRAVSYETEPAPRVSPERVDEIEQVFSYMSPSSGTRTISREMACDAINAFRDLRDRNAEVASLRAELEAERKSHEECVERVESLEDAVRENLPEVTCDSDGNLESDEVCRIETVGFLYDELEKKLAAALSSRPSPKRVRELANEIYDSLRNYASTDDDINRASLAVADLLLAVCGPDKVPEPPK